MFCLYITDIAQNSVHQFPRSKSVTSWQLPHLRRSYRETCLMDFGLIVYKAYVQLFSWYYIVSYARKIRRVNCWR